MGILFGCHGSTWELDYDKETDYLDGIMDTVSNAGFKGIDVQIALLGRYKHSPEQLENALGRRGLKLAALTLPFSWNQEKETEDERKLADYYIEYVKHFSNAILNVAPRVGSNRNDLLKRQIEIIQCANNLAKRAYEKGVQCSFHPSSPPTSYFRTKDDYDVLFERLDKRYIGYTPDAGHIMYGGMDPVEIVRENLSIIKHVHFKDASSTPNWKKMGAGGIDFPEIVRSLVDFGYKGWIMVEEETKESSKNPNAAVMDIGKFVSTKLKPLTLGEK